MKVGGAQARPIAMVEEGASKGDEGRDAAAGAANEDQVKNAVAFLTHPKVSCSLKRFLGVSRGHRKRGR